MHDLQKDMSRKLILRADVCTSLNERRNDEFNAEAPCECGLNELPDDEGMVNSSIEW